MRSSHPLLHFVTMITQKIKIKGYHRKKRETMGDESYVDGVFVEDKDLKQIFYISYLRGHFLCQMIFFFFWHEIRSI